MMVVLVVMGVFLVSCADGIELYEVFSKNPLCTNYYWAARSHSCFKDVADKRGPGYVTVELYCYYYLTL